MAEPGTIGIIGCGIVGRSWAVSFARAGYRVRVYDPDPHVAKAALSQLEDSIRQLHTISLLDGQDTHANFPCLMIHFPQSLLQHFCTCLTHTFLNFWSLFHFCMGFSP